MCKPSASPPASPPPSRASCPTRARARTRRTCSSSSSTTSASRSSGASVPASRRRTSTGGRPGPALQPVPRHGCLLRRPGPRCSPGATTTRSAWASPRRPRSGSRTTAGSRAATPRWPGAARPRLQHDGGRWHLTPRRSTPRPGRSSGGRSASVRALLRLPRGGDQPVGPELVRDNHAGRGHPSRRRGYHLTEDLVDQAIGMIRDQQQAAARKPFFCYLAPGAATRRTRSPRSGWRRTAGSSTTAGRPGGSAPTTGRLPRAWCHRRPC